MWMRQKTNYWFQFFLPYNFEYNVYVIAQELKIDREQFAGRYSVTEIKFKTSVEILSPETAEKYTNLIIDISAGEALTVLLTM